MAKTKRRKGKGSHGARRSGEAQRPQLSVCLIARDEADFLDACLSSVREIADEILVVDTGSTDETPTIARRHGARVFDRPWDGDFAAARNHGLNAARGRWILSLDCDETIAQRDLATLRQATQADDIDAYRITTRNYTRKLDSAEFVECDGSYDEEREYPGWFPTTKVRLWRSHKTRRFVGAVHELVEPTLDASRTGDCLVPVHHYGVEKTRADDRYVEAGERKVEQNPDDLRARFELAISYRDADKLDAALPEIERVVAALDQGASGTYLDEEKARLVHGDILDRLQRFEESLAVYLDVVRRFAGSFQACNNAGSLLGRLGRYAEARTQYARAVELAPDNRVIADNLRKLDARLASTPTEGSHAISLCVIVRNGAVDLDRCLSSVKGAVDEIVVVDTGSDDDSIQVAERHGARVGTFTWVDDFAAARNASLDMATGAWILWMDADDYLLPEDRDKVQRVRQMAPDSALSFTLVNTGGQDNSRFRQIKMFPNRSSIRFSRPVHETVLPALEREGIEAKTTDVSVMHTGYADASVVAQKTARYRVLMERWLLDHPDDLDVTFRLGHTAYTEGRRDDAVTWFERVLAAGTELRPRSLRRNAFLFRGRSRLEQGDWQSSIADFELALALDDGNVFANVSLGDALTKAGRHDEAVRHLRRGLSGTHDDTFPLERAVIDYTAQYFLGESLSALGQIDEAVSAFESAHRILPERAEAVQAVRQLRPSQGNEKAGTVEAFEPPRTVDSTARLTLCMIVRNEEERLAECLESARAAVDEIVVVDTGSTDGTVAIAEQYGATMGTFDWCDDFSAARNVSLQLATGDWILWLDADDRLPAEYVETIRQLIAGPRDRGYFFVLDDRGYESVSCLQMRLFPNIPGVQFEMPIHEQVTPSLARLGVEMVPTPVRVVHTGYTTPEIVAEKKNRYLRIMEDWLQAHPADYIVRSHVALTYHTTGRLEESAEQYRLIVEESDCRADRNFVILTTALLFLGRTWQKLDDLDAALRWLRHAESVDSDYVLTQYSLADVLLDMGEAAQAIPYAEKVLARDQPQMTFFPIDQRELRYSALHVLGRAHAQLQDLGAAAQRLREASQVPVARRSEALGQLAETYKQAKQLDQAATVLREALSIDEDHPRHLFNLGMVCLEAGEAVEATTCFEKVLAVVGDESSDARIRALLNLGFVAKAQADPEKAEARYLDVLSLDPDHVDAKANLGHLYLTQERHDDAETRFREVLDKQPGLLDIELGLLLAVQSAGRWDPDLADRIHQAVPEAGADPASDTGDEQAAAFVQVGAALIRRSLPRCAEMAFQIAVGLVSDESSTAAHQAQRCLAEIYFSQGKFWDSVARWEAVLRLAPTDTDAFRRLGDTYTRLGVEDAAKLCYERAAG